MIVTVNGKAYIAAIDGSGVPEEEGWPVPSMRKVGRGFQAVFDVTPEQARLIESHLQDLGETWSGAGVDGGGPDGRACLAAAKSIRDALVT